MAEEEPKIFIDEDWKAKVQREREAAPEPPEADATAEEEGAPDGMPEPSITAIVNNLAAQTMMALGGMPSGPQGEVYVDLHQGKFCIECLAILREKTAGNLDEKEGKYIDEVLGQLAQAFEMLLKELDEQTMRDAGVNQQDFKLK